MNMNPDNWGRTGIATNTVLPHNGRMPNTFGHLFRITTWGESHGGGVGVVLDGCPPQLDLDESDIQPDLDRRRPGQSKTVTPPAHAATLPILSRPFAAQTPTTPNTPSPGP